MVSHEQPLESSDPPLPSGFRKKIDLPRDTQDAFLKDCLTRLLSVVNGNASFRRDESTLCHANCTVLVGGTKYLFHLDIDEDEGFSSISLSYEEKGAKTDFGFRRSREPLYGQGALASVEGIFFKRIVGSLSLEFTRETDHAQAKPIMDALNKLQVLAYQSPVRFIKKASSTERRAD